MRGFSYYELLISVVLIAVALLTANGWYRHYSRESNKLLGYYQQREFLINKSVLHEGEEILVTKNLHILRAVTGNLVLEYGLYKP